MFKDSIEANLARAKLEARLHQASTPEVGGPKSCGRTRASPACFISLCLGSRSPRKRKGVSFLGAFTQRSLDEVMDVNWPVRSGLLSWTNWGGAFE